MSSWRLFVQESRPYARVPAASCVYNKNILDPSTPAGFQLLRGGIVLVGVTNVYCPTTGQERQVSSLLM